ncbi:hypothetical protein [Streptomyces sp. NPDC089919]|uniref:hypothetical protein n=1 Tax=Streptomyces sp. NPDC089919 TaxID=3155188 RepID=UPI00343CC652
MEWDWTTTEYGEAHAGAVGALLADGTEPGPAYFDTGSGPEVHSTTHWSAYDGQLGQPRAAALRAACACGWRGPAEYPLDWDAIGDKPLDEAGIDLAGPLGDWTAHLAVVRETVVPLPPTLDNLLQRLTDHLESMTGDAPLAALRAAAVLERVAAQITEDAADILSDGSMTAEQLATALGTTETKAMMILLRGRDDW